MATRVERSGIEGCISRVNTGIENLNSAATAINAAMDELCNHWEGAAYNKAMSVYDEEYRDLLTKTVPEAVEEFKNYINQCMEMIIDLDNQLAG